MNMQSEIDLRTYDFSEPFFGTIVKNQHIWRRYAIEKSIFWKLKGLSLLIYKLAMPVSAHWGNPCSKNS
jgi:hypothetical protein